MNAKWQTVRLGEVLCRVKDVVRIDDGQTYSRLTIRMSGKGIIIRDRVPGHEIGTKRQFLAKAGQLVLSKIDARNGAFGILTPECDNAIITGNFWAFDILKERLHPAYCGYLTRTPMFVDFCIRASEGSTNRRYLQEDAFLRQELRLPPLPEQLWIVARIDELAAQINEARALRQQTMDAANAMITSKMWESIKESGDKVRYIPFTEITCLERRPVIIQPHQSYQEIGVYSYGRGIFHKSPRTGVEVGSKDLYQIRAGDFVLQITFAWEGAVALAEQRDDGLYGSVRYLTFRVNEDICSPWYLLTYMKTPEAISQLVAISPGSAGRNRVLSVKRLGEVVVPVLPIEDQKWMSDTLRTEFYELQCLQTEIASELDALLPSIVAHIFNNEL